MEIKRLTTLLILFLIPLNILGCNNKSNKDTLYVFVASSLTDVMTELADAFTKETNIAVGLNLAGSQRLSTQIENGMPAHVFISADYRHADRLFQQAMLTTPQEVAKNQIVFALANNVKGLDSLEDLVGNIKLSLGNEDVPIGKYTRNGLEKLELIYGAGYKEKVLKNAVSLEIDVKQVIARVVSGQVEGDFVYRTDTLVTSPPLQYISLPKEAEVNIDYFMGLTIRQVCRVRRVKSFISLF